MYELFDAEQCNRDHPDTFEIPSLNDRNAVKVGQCAKIGFVVRPDHPIRCERMWVRVTERLPGNSYKGVLDNTPVYSMNVAWGDEIHFSASHIMDIWD